MNTKHPWNKDVCCIFSTTATHRTRQQHSKRTSFFIQLPKHFADYLTHALQSFQIIFSLIILLVRFRHIFTQTLHLTFKLFMLQQLPLIIFQSNIFFVPFHVLFHASFSPCWRCSCWSPSACCWFPVSTSMALYLPRISYCVFYPIYMTETLLFFGYLLHKGKFVVAWWSFSKPLEQRTPILRSPCSIALFSM